MSQGGWSSLRSELFRLDGVREDAEAGDGNFNSVAGGERAYTGGGAGED
jgi:hypothetical protein